MIGLDTLDSTKTAAASSATPSATSPYEVIDAQSKFLPAKVTQMSRVLTPEAMRAAPR